LPQVLTYLRNDSWLLMAIRIGCDLIDQETGKVVQYKTLARSIVFHGGHWRY